MNSSLQTFQLAFSMHCIDLARLQMLFNFTPYFATPYYIIFSSSGYFLSRMSSCLFRQLIPKHLRPVFFPYVARSILNPYNTVRSSLVKQCLVNPLNPELNPICYLLALLAHHFLHVSRIRVKSLTIKLLMSYIYMEHLFLMFLDHTQRRSTVGRTPLDE